MKTKLERIRERAQFAANANCKPMAILNLNSYSPLYVAREWNEHFTGARDLVEKINPIPAAFIAAQFVERLKAVLSPDEWREMTARNANEQSALVCHSHDFLDANEIMASAFTIAMGREPDVSTDIDCALWNDAWNIAHPVLSQT